MDFERVAVARDGKKVAAAAAPGQVEIACVWDIEGGPPRVVQGHTRAITALDFSEDGRSLLTASEDGTAKLWNLEPGGPGPDRPALVLSAPNASAITAARICPSRPRRIVTAHWAAARSPKSSSGNGSRASLPNPDRWANSRAGPAR